jgi:hypothetical protein
MSIAVPFAAQPPTRSQGEITDMSSSARTQIDPAPASPGVSDAGDPFAALRRELDELRMNHERRLHEHQTKLDSLSADNNGLREISRALEGNHAQRAIQVQSVVGEENEHQRKLDELRNDLQGKLDSLTAENSGLKERFCALEARELGKEVAVADLKLEVETNVSVRRPSMIAMALMALEDTEDTEETEEHELADSMWDACLFLGCKDDSRVKGESMNVGILVTIFGILALLINALIQTAIVAVVVYKMADNADIKDSTAADMRRASRSHSSPHRALAATVHARAGHTVLTSGTTSTTSIPTRTCLSQLACATTWRASSSRSKQTSFRTSSTTRTAI